LRDGLVSGFHLYLRACFVNALHIPLKYSPGVASEEESPSR
jgi:hypothetical protein